MKKFSLMIFLTLIIVVNLRANDKENLTKNILELTEPKEKQAVCMMFLYLGNCQKCFTIPQMFQKMIFDTLGADNFKQIGAANILKDKEVNYFKKKFNWQYPLLAKSHEVSKQLNMNYQVIYIVFDSKGNILYNVDLPALESDFYNEFNKLKQILIKYFSS